MFLTSTVLASDREMGLIDILISVVFSNVCAV